MSGTIVNNVARASGTIAATPGGLDWSAAVVTASTVTVEAGRGYFINTTSNACTITLPASAEIGDQIVIADYARTWSTNKVFLDSNGLKFQGSADTYEVDYSTVGQSLNIVFSDSTKGWLPVSDDAVAFEHGSPPTQRGLFAFGQGSDYVNTRNLVNSSGVIASDANGAGTARSNLAGTTYGGDKGIFAFGNAAGSGYDGMSNLVNNSGVVGSDVTAVGTARQGIGAAQYGVGKAIFAFGFIGPTTGISNLVTTAGVVGSDVSAVGTARNYLAGVNYGGDKAIFGFGRIQNGNATGITNLVNNSGVVQSDTSAVGTARKQLAGASYGGDKGLFVGGTTGSTIVSLKNLINNSGTVLADVAGVGSATASYAGTMYGGDKAVFAYGISSDGEDDINKKNLVNNAGVMATDVTGVGTARQWAAALGYSFSA